MHLKAQIEFLLTCDQPKNVVRQNYLYDGTRYENSAEHSWFLTLMALTLAEYAPANTNINHVIKLLIVHDLVEVFAGDAYIETPEEQAQQTEKEQRAAKKLFGLLPENQSREFHGLWNEFEEKLTSEAQFARQLDAFAPTLLTWADGGHGREHWGKPSQKYKDLKRRTITQPEFLALFESWMQREESEN